MNNITYIHSTINETLELKLKLPKKFKKNDDETYQNFIMNKFIPKYHKKNKFEEENNLVYNKILFNYSYLHSNLLSSNEVILVIKPISKLRKKNNLNMYDTTKKKLTLFWF